MAKEEVDFPTPGFWSPLTPEDDKDEVYDTLFFKDKDHYTWFDLNSDIAFTLSSLYFSEDFSTVVSYRDFPASSDFLLPIEFTQ